MNPGTPVRFLRLVRLVSSSDGTELVGFPGDCGTFVGPAEPTILDPGPVYRVAVRVNEDDFTAVCVAADFEPITVGSFR